MRKKSWAAALISAMLAIGMMPMTAFAAGNVAMVEGQAYSSLQDAIDQANGKTVELIADVQESISIPGESRVKLDLGSFTLTNTEGEHTITNNGTLTIQGSGKVDNISHARAALYNTTTGKTVINSGTFSRSKEASISATDGGGNSWYVIYNQGEMEINGGTFQFSDTNNGPFSSLIVNGWPSPGGNTGKVFASLTIQGGNFTGGKMTVKNDDYGKLDIQNGTFEQPNDGYYCVFSWNEAEISGGTIDGTIGAQGDGNTSQNAYEHGKLTVTGGIFTSGVEANANADIQLQGGSFQGALTTTDDSASLAVSGGNYAQSPAAYVVSSRAAIGYRKGGAAPTYYVGTAQEIAQKVQSAERGDAIEVLSGDLDLTIAADGVSVTNAGTGKVTVNEQEVPQGGMTTHTHQAVKQEAKEPTATQEGNIEYWYCQGCGKYFSDAALTVEIQKEDTILPATGAAEQEDASKTDIPRTGDASQTGWLFAGMLVALAGAGLSLKYRKKEQAE